MVTGAMPSSSKKRLDVLLVERGLAPSRERAQAVILAGQVWTEEQRLEKPGHLYDENIALEVRGPESPFASRAGHKLEAALTEFHILPSGKVCIDIGASTGGFTDCLLKAGAERVFAVDVGYGQLENRLRIHPQVTNLERTNARHLTRATLLAAHPSAAKIALVAMDVSFISLQKIIAPLRNEISAPEWVLLFKPQFEMGRAHIGKGGIVRPDAPIKEALAAFIQWMETQGFQLKGGPQESPLAGKKSGNLEYLLYFVRP